MEESKKSNGFSKNNQNKKLTKEELIKLESKPRNKGRERFRLILPILAGLIAIFEYVYLPDHNPSAQKTNLYNGFLWILLGIYGIALVVSIKKESLRERLVYRSPFYTFVFILLILYDVLTLKTGKLDLPYFPWIDMIFNSMKEDKSFLIESVLSSLKLLFTGYFIGAGLGIITGILAGYFDKVNYWVDPFLKLLGPIPTTTWLPVVMVLAINLFQGAIFIISLGVWFSTTLATITGIHNVDPAYYEAAQTLGATNSELVRKVAIKSASPNIFQGLVAGMSAACNALIVAEMLGVESGLGWYITWKSSWANYSAMYGAIILLAITFILVNSVIKRISTNALKWRTGGVSR
ncbi:ABC transporter permease [Anaerococcus sp. ENR1011]|uniref:ABC transporter permease n=1 Tax=Anaerococcus groningensis TaxID=3115616 RepID=A0ABW9N1P0_9FIRM